MEMVKEQAQSTTSAPAQKQPESLTTPPPEAKVEQAQAQGEVKEAGTQSLVDPPNAKEEAPKAQAPEKYELKLPENSALSPDQVEKTVAFAREQGFSNEMAQKILERENQIASDFQARQVDQVAASDRQWYQEIASDKEFGGTAFSENGVLAASAAEKFFGQEFVQMLKAAKLNHHPMLFKGLVRIAKATADDKLVRGGVQAKPVVSTAEKLYGKTK